MSTKGKEKRLDIRIGGKIDRSLNSTLSTSGNKLRTFSRQIDKLDKTFSKLDKGYDKIAQISGKAFNYIERGAVLSAGAVQGIGIASTMAGSKFESAFTGVKKTVDGTKKEYQGLKEEILSLTRLIPKSGDDLSGIMETAGQLGIKKNALPDFTKTMANLDVSTNMSSEEAATSFARFANITGMKANGEDGTSNYEKLGSTVVDLGNKFATTEQEIVEMGLNLSSTGKLIGLSAPEIMALGTALSSVGIKAEKGGSAMSKLFRKMQTSVELNDDFLSDYASVSGMKEDEFKTVFKNNPLTAITKFLSGLNDTKRNKKSAVTILNEMKLSEVRMSDTILRLAGSSGNMSKAIETANKAWKENTALTTEANKRYETFESQADLTKNAFTEMGISIYDNLTRTPVVDIMKKLRVSVNDFTDNGLNEWLDKINYKLPTFKRQIEHIADNGPLVAKIGIGVGKWVLDAGKWVLNNGDYVLSVFEGIGTAMLSYKVASSAVHFINGLMSLGNLSPVGIAITGIATAIGAIVAIYEGAKADKIRQVNEAMAKSFGKIALSIEDIEKVAKDIIGKKRFEKLAKSAEQFKKADDMAKGLRDTLVDLDRRNWKAKLGIELNEEEGEDYKNAIADYIKNAQEYVLQERYAISVSLKLTQGENSVIAGKVDSFYNSAYLQMQKLGKELSDTVNEAFSDNILDEKEIQKIAKLEQKMAKLQAKLATSDFESGLIKLGKKFDGSKLDSESFKNLQDELGKQAEEAEEKYLEVYGRNKAGLKLSFDEGVLSKEEYEKGIKQEDEKYLKNISSIYEKVAKFQIDAIEKAKKIGLDNAFNETIEKNAVPDKWLLGSEERIKSIKSDVIEKYGLVLDGSDELLKNMEIPVEKLKELEQTYKELGMSVPKTITDTLDRIEKAQNRTDEDKYQDQQFFTKEFGKRTSASKYDWIYENIIKKLSYNGDTSQEYGFFSKSFFENEEKEYKEQASKAFEKAHKGFTAYAEKYILDWYDKNSFKINANVDLTLNPLSTKWLKEPSLNIPGGSDVKIYKNAEGGIWHKPILTTFAEEGPEAAIPLDGSNRAISLWEKAGEYLGMKRRVDGIDLSGANNTTTIEYKPTLQFYGEAPKKSDLREALSMSQREFNAMMDNYVKTRGRVAF